VPADRTSPLARLARSRGAGLHLSNQRPTGQRRSARRRADRRRSARSGQHHRHARRSKRTRPAAAITNCEGRNWAVLVAGLFHTLVECWDGQSSTYPHPQAPPVPVQSSRWLNCYRAAWRCLVPGSLIPSEEHVLGTNRLRHQWQSGAIPCRHRKTADGSGSHPSRSDWYGSDCRWLVSSPSACPTSVEPPLT